MIPFKHLLRIARPRQYAKNFLLFAGLVFSNHFLEPLRIGYAFLGFLIFCIFSSLIYIVNDLRDAESDRSHPLKRHRPLANRTLFPHQALSFGAILAVAGVVLLFLMPTRFVVITSIYVVMMILYSTWLKHHVILDLMIVAIGFVLRGVAGVYAIEQPGELIEVTPWFITCVLFLALFIILCKRRHELVLLEGAAHHHRPVLEHYSQLFLDQMVNVATTATVMSYTLYVTIGVEGKPGAQYMVYTLPFVVYGIFRYLYLVYKREEGGRPEALVFQDTSLLAAVVLWIMSVVLIIAVGAEG